MTGDFTSGESNPRFELAVLGAALTNQDAWDTISRKLTPRDFTLPAHAQLYDEIIRSETEDRWGDIDLIAQSLVNGGTADGYEIVANAVSGAAPSSTLTHYIEDLRQRSQSRRATMISLAFSQKVSQTSGDSAAFNELLADFQDDMRAISEDVAEEPWESVGDLLKKVEQGDTRMLATFPTGFADLDKILQGGFRPRQMVTIAGRPAMGKSTLAVDFARYASFRRGIPGLMVSLEMSAEEVATRIASAEAAIPMNNLINDELSDLEVHKIAEVRERLEDSPLDILDAEDGSWGTIRAAITSAHRRNAIEYVIIDYLQLVTLESKQRNMSRQEEVSTISRSIKLLAKQLGITVIAVAQLSRAVENRTGQIPQMSDLRESGSIEQDSDIVGFVHRPDYYDKMSERAGEGDVIIAKQRNGPTGTASLAFQGHYSRFVSLAYQYDSEADESYQEA